MSENIKQAFVEGFVTRLAQRGVFPSELEKIAAAPGWLSVAGKIIGGGADLVGDGMVAIGKAVGPALAVAGEKALNLGGTALTGALLAPPAAAAGLGYLSAGQMLPQEDEVRALQDEQMLESYRQAIDELKAKQLEREKNVRPKQAVQGSAGY